MQVVIEDYVAGEGVRVVALLAVKFVLAALAASCVLAVVLVALRS
jgi:succinate dehydrogenase hydrophobic anchor subunit